MVLHYFYGGVALLIAFRIMVLGLLLAGMAGAATLTVNNSGGAEYTTINDAINQSKSEDTIQVQNGTYYENVNVNKTLTLRGIGMPVVNANGSGSAVTLAANGITLEGFTAAGAGYSEAGIRVTSNNNTLVGNNASNNDYGIFLESSSNNTLRRNNAYSNNINFIVSGVWDSRFENQIDTSNLVNGKTIYYLKGAANAIYNSSSNIGTFYCISCVNVTIKDLNLNRNDVGVFFWNTTQSRIQNITSSNNNHGISLSSSNNNTVSGNNVNSNNNHGISLESSRNNSLSANNVSNNCYNYTCLGIYLSSSSNNMLTGNNASKNGIGISLFSSSNNMITGNDASNNGEGIWLFDSRNNTIRRNIANLNNGESILLFNSGNNILSDNNANSNSLNGIYVDSSNNNTISGNNVSNNGEGIWLYNSSNNMLTGNNASRNNERGISVYSSSNNTLYGNDVSNNNYGISLKFSRYNIIYHNNFIQNTDQAYEHANKNLWDSGYPSGGNFWSDHNGVDNKSGPSQNIPGSDGIGDTPYRMNSSTGAQDNYPLMDQIVPEGITITSPDGAQIWSTGTNQTIRWNYFGFPGAYVKIELWKNGIRNSVITSSTLIGSGGSGSYDWFIKSTQTPGADYKIMVTSTAHSIYTDTSDNNFTIRTPIPSIIVTSPNGSENWTRGTAHAITWNSSGIPGAYVKIELLKAGIWKSTIISSTPNDGSHPWLIPVAQTPGNDYKVRITSTTSAAYTDTSDNTFTIPTPIITVISPNEGENWKRWITQTIRWNSSGSPGSYVKIELLKAGILKSTIISSTLNDGSHPWIIPATLAKGTDYKVRITSTTNATYTDTSDNNFTIATPDISVITPNGSETWRRGTTQTITWNSSGSTGAYVKVELLKSGMVKNVIIASTLNDGTHPWLIPVTQAPGDDYKVRITSMTNAAYTGTSDNNFTIHAPSFTIVSPNGSENWIRGTTQTIRWNSTESPGSYVKIELLKPGTANKVIIVSTLNDGTHPWLIPAAQAPGTDYIIKITSIANVSNNDSSDSNFTIPAPSFFVVSPNGSENWTRGTTQTIRWNSTESPGTYVKIELLKPGVTNKVLIASTLNDGSHPWLIPAIQTPGADYKIKVSSTANVSNNDTSDNNFSIVPPKITVTSPDGDENWTRGTAHAITWNYTGNPGTYVKIELLKNGMVNRTILASTPNDKSQSWTIPAVQAIGTDYRVRITSTTNAAYNDTSDANFNISAIIP
ncbi:MAG TPA: NosD domain-containing protein [Candidatus Limnocylindrales bacterium]|nr:NosD domain-containing protein [Candidatus Limnocylindrales bacterium]